MWKSYRGGGTFHDRCRQEVLESPWILRLNTELHSYFSKYLQQRIFVKYTSRPPTGDTQICTLICLHYDRLCKQCRNMMDVCRINRTQITTECKAASQMTVYWPWQTNNILNWHLLLIHWNHGQLLFMKWWNHGDKCTKRGHSCTAPDVCGMRMHE